ncbi:hypothetical protein KY339_06185 [Candidatus Woesearchaeota archaeon]|nr:hypothetical protein [Candidatus Woesearchaeota archaeon]
MSSKNRLIFAVLVISLLLLFVKPALGVSEDFNTYASKQTVKVCACSLAENPLTVENTGDITSTYKLTQQGSGAEFSTITENVFSLELGQTKRIDSFINVPCDARGEYELVTNINTLFGLTSQLSQTIEAQNCVNVQMTALDYSQRACPCSPVDYSFRIANPGSFLETYRLSVPGYDDWIDISEEVLILEPGQNQVVHVFVNLPCDMYGEYELKLVALAESTNMQGEINFELGIDPCYDYSMSSQDEVTACQKLQTLMPITVNNEADVSNVFELSTNQPWAWFENNSLFLWPKQQGDVNLIIDPLAIEPGLHNLTVSSFGVRGEVIVTRNIIVNVENCYELNLNFMPYQDIVVQCESNRIDFSVMNNGTQQGTFDIVVDGPEWVTLLNDPLMAVLPGQERQGILEAVVPCEEVFEEYALSVTMSLQNHPDVSFSTITNLKPVAVEDAYGVEISSLDELKVDYETNIIPINFENTGVKSITYLITMNGSGWMSLEENSITLLPGGGGVINLTTTPTEDVPEGKYALAISAQPEGKNLVYLREFEIDLKEKTFWEKLIDNWYWWVIPLVIIALIAVGAILLTRKKEEGPELIKKVATKETEKEKKISHLWWVIPLIVLLLAAIGGAVYMLSAGSADQEINQTSLEEATIYVDRTGLEGSGNEIIIRENVTIPLIIQNNDVTNTYHIEVQEDVEWITLSEQEVRINSGQNKTVYLLVAPTNQTEEGVYKITIDVTIEDTTETISEEIELNVKKKKSLLEYWPYALIGLILAGLVILLHWLATREKGEKPAPKEESLSIKSKKIKKKRDYSILKKALLALLLLAILVAIVGGSFYLVRNVQAPVDDQNATETEEVEHKDVVDSTIYVDRTGLEGSGNEIIIRENVTIPLIIQNNDVTNTYHIEVQEDVDWITISEQEVQVDAGESEIVNLLVTPTNQTEEGIYKITIDVTIEDTTEMISEELMLDVKPRKSFGEKFVSYLLYIIIGLILGGIAIAAIHFSGKRAAVPKKYKKPEVMATKTGLKLR